MTPFPLKASLRGRQWVIPESYGGMARIVSQRGAKGPCASGIRKRLSEGAEKRRESGLALCVRETLAKRNPQISCRLVGRSVSAGGEVDPETRQKNTAWRGTWLRRRQTATREAG
jgi:hypothetical protein